jgi:hypothetical protein
VKTRDFWLLLFEKYGAYITVSSSGQIIWAAIVYLYKPHEYLSNNFKSLEDIPIKFSKNHPWIFLKSSRNHS